MLDKDKIDEVIRRLDGTPKPLKRNFPPSRWRWWLSWLFNQCAVWKLNWENAPSRQKTAAEQKSIAKR